MAKKGENIYKRKDGRWEARYPKKQENGRIVYGYVYGQTYKEAKIKKAQLLISLNNTSICTKNHSSNITLRELANEWLIFKKENVKESTYVRYRHLFEKHIGDVFGDLALNKLDTAKIETHIRSKQTKHVEKSLAPKTVQDILSVFRLIVAYGIEKGVLSSDCLIKPSNQMLLRKNDSKISILLPGERIILERFVLERKDVRSFGILLALYTGIRIGELCALKWSDIDITSGILHINHTLQRLHDYNGISDKKTKIVISTPKTESSARMIPLSSFLIDRLSNYESYPNHFLLTDATIPEETRSYLYFYKRILKLCSLPDYNFHTIRHTFATRCIEEGTDIKSLSEILGHSNVKITMNRYVHPSLETKRQYLEKLVVSL